MTTPNELSMFAPGYFVNPITYRWHVLSPFGASQAEVTVNVPVLIADWEATKRFAHILWAATVASATCIDTALLSTTVTAWNPGVTEEVPAPSFTLGRYPASSGSRDDTACIVLHTGHQDRFALRRLPIIGTPAAWVDGGCLTTTAMQILESTALSWRMGLTPEVGTNVIDWLIAYRDVDLGPGAGILPLGFRRVYGLRLLYYSVRAPEASIG